MRLNITKQLSRCHVVTLAILMLGLGSSAIIYLTAGETRVDPFAEFENSKKFAYELERMGGKSAIFANEINKWFSSLWHGEALSYTVAVITILVAAVYYFITTSLAAEARIINKKGEVLS